MTSENPRADPPAKDLYFHLAAICLVLVSIATPILFPDWKRMVLVVMFATGIAGAIVFTTIPLFLYRFSRPWCISGGVLFIITAVAWWFWPSDIFDKSMPGLSVLMDGRIYDTPDKTNRQLFKLENSHGGGASLYLSASGLFTFSVTDNFRSTYDLEARLHRSELPIDEFITLFCELANHDHQSTMRIVVNGKEIRRRTIPATLSFRGDWGGDWKPQIGGGALFSLITTAVWSNTVPNDKIQKISDDSRRRREAN